VSGDGDDIAPQIRLWWQCGPEEKKGGDVTCNSSHLHSVEIASSSQEDLVAD
jgi:hypothetical protein